jgi:hypothetical protein
MSVGMARLLVRLVIAVLAIAICLPALGSTADSDSLINLGFVVDRNSIRDFAAVAKSALYAAESATSVWLRVVACERDVAKAEALAHELRHMIGSCLPEAVNRTQVVPFHVPEVLWDSMPHV